MTATTSKPVIVTGTLSGIGRASAVRIVVAGFRVFAGVRKETDAQSLCAEHPDIEPVTFDVTDAISIVTANTRLEATLAELDGLVNNAGISVTGPMEYIVLDELLADAVLRGQVLAPHVHAGCDQRWILTWRELTSTSRRCGRGTGTPIASHDLGALVLLWRPRAPRRACPSVADAHLDACRRAHLALARFDLRPG